MEYKRTKMLQEWCATEILIKDDAHNVRRFCYRPLQVGSTCTKAQKGRKDFVSGPCASNL